MYIAISSPEDGHLAYVERHLDQPFTLFNTRDILDKIDWSYYVQSGGRSTLKYKRKIDVPKVASVWYRRAMFIQKFELPVAEGKKDFAMNAIEHFSKLMFAQLADALWVSDYFAIQKANDKLWQLQVAARIGFNVPDTLFTSSARDALNFVRRHKAVVAKSNYSSHFRHEGKQYGFYTARVNADTDFSGLSLAPAIIQRAVNVKTELRITVVGSTVFAASVTADFKDYAKHIRDWRVATFDNSLNIEAFDLPKKIADQCVALVKELGLQFGAIDMIIDRRGKFWFLENNPQGQWAFVENATGQPIGKALAKLLMRDNG